jgi:hypothetical protein
MHRVLQPQSDSVYDSDESLNHPQLSSLEQEVLWEYAKLGDKTKRVRVASTSDSPWYMV